MVVPAILAPVSGQSGLLCEIVRHCLQKRKKDQLGRLSFITYSVLPFVEKEDEDRADSVLLSHLRQSHWFYHIWDFYCNLCTAALLKMDHLLCLSIFFKW